MCVTTSNLVVLHQRVYIKIEQNPKHCVALVGTWLTPSNYSPPMLPAKFGLSMSKATDVIKEIHMKICPLRPQDHSRSSQPTWIDRRYRLPTNTPWQPWGYPLPFPRQTAISVETRQFSYPCIWRPCWRGSLRTGYRRQGQKTRMMDLPGQALNFNDIFSRLDTILEYDGQTDRRTPADSMYLAYA